jgi:hypothetical protein
MLSSGGCRISEDPDAVQVVAQSPEDASLKKELVAKVHFDKGATTTP